MKRRKGKKKRRISGEKVSEEETSMKGAQERKSERE